MSIFIEGVVYITLNIWSGQQVSSKNFCSCCEIYANPYIFCVQTGTLYTADPVLLGLHFSVLLIFASVMATAAGWYSKKFRRVKELLVAGYIVSFPRRMCYMLDITILITIHLFRSFAVVSWDSPSVNQDHTTTVCSYNLFWVNQTSLTTQFNSFKLRKLCPNRFRFRSSVSQRISRSLECTLADAPIHRQGLIVAVAQLAVVPELSGIATSVSLYFVV